MFEDSDKILDFDENASHSSETEKITREHIELLVLNFVKSDIV